MPGHIEVSADTNEPMSESAPNPIVSIRNLSKSFSGVRALDNAQFDLLPGEVHALMGENGAGKSTLMKVLVGVYQKDAGEILLDGRPVEIDSPHAAQGYGIGIIHQELNLMNHLSAAQNIFIGREPRGRFGVFLDENALNQQARRIFETMHLQLDPRVLVGTLSVAKQQMVEIAKALSFDSRVLIAKLKISPFIATLGMMMLLKGLSLVISGTKPIYFNDTPEFSSIAQDSLIGYFIPSAPIANAVLILFLVAIAASIVLNKTILDRYTFAPGGNEGSAIGAVNGVKEMKRKIVIIGYDSGKQQKDAIRSGAMAGAITQNPVGIGYRTVEAAVKALKGEKLPKIIDTGFYWYDKSNMQDPKIAAVLYD
jgi:ABC-type branched-subunit amino acid transport system ATPase component